MMDIFYLQNSIKKGDISQLSKLKKKPIWIDITDLESEDISLLQEHFGIHPLTTEDLSKYHTRIKLEEFPDYLFCVFYVVSGEQATELCELDFILGKNFLITNHKEQIDFFSLIKEHKETIEPLLKKGSDFLFHRLLDQKIDDFLPMLDALDDQIESIDEAVTKKPKREHMMQIMKIKRKIIAIKKATLPQREKIGMLAKGNIRFISKPAQPYFRDIYDHAIKVSDSVDSHREAIGGTFDAYMSSVSNNTNDVMKTMSAIATITLPMMIISGIYGTNFDFLPGQHSPHGFWLMLVGMLCLMLVILYSFKVRKWF